MSYFAFRACVDNPYSYNVSLHINRCEWNLGPDPFSVETGVNFVIGLRLVRFMILRMVLHCF